MMAAPRLVQETATRSQVCRCGSRIEPGSTTFRVLDGAGAPLELVGAESFCSVPCVRATFLETLSVLEGLDTPGAEAIVTDLRVTYVHLVSTFASIIEQSPTI
jgi:hypothetical protein